MRDIRLRIYAALCAIAALVSLAGCARARVTTEIRSDGSWMRTVALTGQEKKEGMQMTPTLEESFTLPSGGGWKSSEGKLKEEHTLTFERVLAAGAMLKSDLSIKGDSPDKVKLTNEVTVARSGPRRFEYRETLHWQGPPPEGFGSIKPGDLAEIKAGLPKSLATDANARALAQKTGALLIPILFGPGDPLLAIGLLHPDLAEKRASQRIGLVLMKALEEQFGDKMDPAQRREVARTLIAKTFSATRPSQPDPSAGPPAGKNSGLTPLMFIVKTKGRIVSSNGEIDELTGEVYWGLFPEAASVKDVTLTAICEAPPG